MDGQAEIRIDVADDDPTVCVGVPYHISVSDPDGLSRVEVFVGSEEVMSASVGDETFVYSDSLFFEQPTTAQLRVIAYDANDNRTGTFKYVEIGGNDDFDYWPLDRIGSYSFDYASTTSYHFYGNELQVKMELTLLRSSAEGLSGNYQFHRRTLGSRVDWTLEGDDTIIRDTIQVAETDTIEVDDLGGRIRDRDFRLAPSGHDGFYLQRFNCSGEEETTYRGGNGRFGHTWRLRRGEGLVESHSKFSSASTAASTTMVRTR